MDPRLYRAHQTGADDEKERQAAGLEVTLI